MVNFGVRNNNLDDISKKIDASDNLIKNLKQSIDDALDHILSDNKSNFEEKEDVKMYLRETVLDEAKRCICTDRQNQYGPPEDSFDLIARFWNVYIQGLVKKRPFNDDILLPNDVAIMMVLLKIARTGGHEHKLDNYIDMAGYAALAAELSTRMVQREI